MNRRSLFKSLAALPLGLLAPVKARAVSAPIQPQVFGGIDMSALTSFVPRDGLAYVHRGEPALQIINTFVLPPYTEEQRRTIERDVRAAEAFDRKRKSH